MEFKELFDVQADALGKGEVLYLLSQRKFDARDRYPELAAVDDLDKEDDLSVGICAGLAMHWLSLRYVGADFPSAPMPIEHAPKKLRKILGKHPHVRVASADVRQAVVNQLIVDRVASTNGLFLAYVDAVMMSQYGIAVDRKAFHNQSGTINTIFLQSEMRRSGWGLYYIGMRRPDGGGHAITIQHDHPHYRVFDGNTGSYSFKSSERLFQFLNAYINEYIYNQLCTEAIWVGKITPRPLSHHEILDNYNRRQRSRIDVPATRAPAFPGSAHGHVRPGRTPAYAPAGW